MGIAAFQWENNQLMLLHNRDNYTRLKIKPAAWDESNIILSGRDEPPSGPSGTWCGISRQGRVAFFLDAIVYYEISSAVEFPIKFLEGNMSPNDFAVDLTKKDIRNFGLAYHLIVADINLNSMVYISKKGFDKKPINKVEVAFGVHTLSFGGLDVELPKDLRLKRLFNEMIGAYANKTLPPVKELATKFMYDPEEAVQNDQMSALFVDMERLRERYRTTCTTALVVKPTKEVDFYERYLEDDEWKDHDFPFSIA